MPTTTNYGWTTPADTDLVKDGASAIRTLGTAIDTTTYNNANAAIAKSIVDAKGDIIVATAADTVSRLAVGANDTILVADSAQATGVKWATPSSGGMTLIETLTLSGSSVTSSSIAASYKNLYIVGRGIYNASSGDTSLLIRFNSDTGNNYSEFGITANGNSSDIYHNIATSRIGTKSMGTSSAYNQVLSLEAHIPRYHNSEIKQIQIFNQGYSSQYTYYGYGLSRGNWNNTAAITTITFFPGAGTFSAGYVYIYGVN